MVVNKTAAGTQDAVVFVYLRRPVYKGILRVVRYRLSLSCLTSFSHNNNQVRVRIIDWPVELGSVLSLGLELVRSMISTYGKVNSIIL